MITENNNDVDQLEWRFYHEPKPLDETRTWFFCFCFRCIFKPFVVFEDTVDFVKRFHGNRCRHHAAVLLTLNSRSV